MGMGYNDDEEDMPAAPAAPSGFQLDDLLGAQAPMGPDQRAQFAKQFGIGAKLQDDESVKSAQDAADSTSKRAAVLQGLAQMFQGKVNPGAFDAARQSADKRVGAAENAFKDRQRVAQYIMSRDDQMNRSAADKQAAEARQAAGFAQQEKQLTARQQFEADEKAKDRAANAARDQANQDLKQQLAESKQAGGAGKLVASEVAQNIGKYDGAINMLGSLEKDWKDKASGTGSSLTQFIPGSKANLYQQGADITAQNIGQILEGGKLTDNDYDRYKKMLPAASDTPSQAQNKIALIRQQILEKKRGSIAGAQQAGYNTAGFDPTPIKIPGLDLNSKAGTATAAPKGKPKTVIQNGHTYTLNEETGQYE